jgi:hypothetical protein
MAGRDDQPLTKWMCMPRRASTRSGRRGDTDSSRGELERNACATHTRRVTCLEYAVLGRPVDRPQSRLRSGE